MWDEHKSGTNTQMGQTHRWEKHTDGTNTQGGQTNRWDKHEGVMKSLTFTCTCRLDSYSNN